MKLQHKGDVFVIMTDCAQEHNEAGSVSSSSMGIEYE